MSASLFILQNAKLVIGTGYSLNIGVFLFFWQRQGCRCLILYF